MASENDEMIDLADRKAWMGILSKAPARRLAELWEAAGITPSHSLLRTPEQGAVMVQARAGATGAPFNLGEMTVTRCAAKLADGTIGHGYVQGRDKDKATTAALIDALMQTEMAGAVREAILTPLANEAQTAAQQKAAKAAATKVAFFTLARGED